MRRKEDSEGERGGDLLVLVDLDLVVIYSNVVYVHGVAVPSLKSSGGKSGKRERTLQFPHLFAPPKSQMEGTSSLIGVGIAILANTLISAGLNVER